jgi:4-aminobutyrate aminotransferase-like enzyme/Ser/Thr protein kinase RdoA (MazF antagonist)
MTGDLLHTPMPALPVEAVLARVEELYGIRAAEATPLSSERDQMLLLPSASPAPVVLKISNRAESPHTLDMENGALRHLAAVAPDLPVPRLVPTRAGELVGSIAGAEGREHLLRALTVVPGQHVEGRPVSPRLAYRIGTICAQVSVGLQGYFHGDAGRQLDWDIRRQRTPGASSPDDRVSVLLAQARPRITAALAATATLPSGVQHADVTLTNVLCDETGAVTGVVDLGDMHHTAGVCDLAVSLTSVLRNTSPDQQAAWSELAAAFLDGYQRVRPLLAEEAALIGHLVLARLVTTLDISRGRADEHPDNRGYIMQYDASTERLLEELTVLSDVELAHQFSRLTGLPTPVGENRDLADRRNRVLGGRLAPTFFADPLHIHAGDGAWLISDEGEPYLDAYNNVAVAGHTHPAINQAVTRQLRTLNTNSRYVHPAIVELAERLTATMPDGLDTCVFVTSGSEAVDLAWRMARAYTGSGGTLIAQWAYHGISTRTFDFSPNDWGTSGTSPDDVATFTAPHESGAPLDEEEARRRVIAGVSDLDSRGHRPGVLMADPQFTSEGILDAPAGFMRGLVDGIHDAGGLFLADEVQSGFGRSGPGLWRFATFGVTPDLVTLGKPMAAGLPVGAVITRREIADAFRYEYFSTFAGSPVAGAAGLAVLDVLTDRRIPQRAVRIGELLRTRLRDLATEHPVITAVRGYGLIAGIDLRESPGGGGRAFTRGVVEGLRQRRVLAGNTGRGGDVLKVRPPLAWEEEHVERFVAALRTVLDAARKEVCRE